MFEITIDDNTVYQAAERFLERLYSPNVPNWDIYSIELNTDSTGTHSLAIYKEGFIIPCHIWQSDTLKDLAHQINERIIK